MSRRPRLLIVDDEPKILEMLEIACEANDWHVDVATSAHTAFERHLDQPYDVLLVDKNMPGMDGISLIRHLRERDTRVRIIVMTAYPSVDSAVQGANLAIDAYLEKPFSTISLVPDTIARSLDELARAREEARGAPRCGGPLAPPAALGRATGAGARRPRSLIILAGVSSPDARGVVTGELSGADDEVWFVSDRVALMQQIGARRPDVLLLHRELATLSVVREIRDRCPRIPLVVASEDLGIRTAREMIELRVNVLAHRSLGSHDVRRPIRQLMRTLRAVGGKRRRHRGRVVVRKTSLRCRLTRCESRTSDSGRGSSQG